MRRKGNRRTGRSYSLNGFKGQLDRNRWRLLPRPLLLGFLVLLTAGLCTVTSPVSARMADASLVPAQTSTEAVASTPDQQGRQLFAAGRFSEAAIAFAQALQAYQTQGDQLRQAMTLSNLALTDQKLGAWTEANQAIAQSLALLKTATLRDRPSVLAQALNIQGLLQLEQGQTEQALLTWEQATATYEQIRDTAGMTETRINQARAMQALGMYRRAIDTLTQITQTLQDQPDSLTKTVGLRSLGDALQVAGDLTHAHEVLQESLAIAERLQIPEAISSANLSLGNAARAQGDAAAALTFYEQATSGAPSPDTRVQAQLNQLSLLILTNQRTAVQPLWTQIQAQLNTLPSSRTIIYAQINFARTLMSLANGVGLGEGAQSSPALLADAPEIARILAIAQQQAQSLNDLRAESYALGSLGELYEQAQQWSDAQTLTERALLLAQSTNASDITYRWQWQLGRILKAQVQKTGSNEYGDAIAAYSDAISTLQSLRTDLVAINPEVQFSFQESVEPIHRELVSLLLMPGTGEDTSENLEKARQVIESLQLAELDNFFREACLNARPVEIDQVDSQAAVIYPIILPDRLEVILSLPQQSLRHYSMPISSSRVENVIGRVRQSVTSRTLNRLYFPLVQQIYNWLIRPAEADLKASGIKTLVFVLDGVFRNIPMSILHDGQHYLIEQYSIALTPGLQLLEPRPLQRQQLRILAAGLTEARQGFSSLPNVASELEEIQAEVPSQVLLNEQFTSTAFRQAINTQPSPIVHLATHGKFSSNLADTFILTWDNRISINQLSDLLQTTDLNRLGPIELLVLSACQTASGDRRAALGLAGVAVRAGARSTLATLWSVDDQATSQLMTRFYKELTGADVTKAEALRRAQESVLQNPEYRQHPFFWAPFVLVGNWL